MQGKGGSCMNVLGTAARAWLLSAAAATLAFAGETAKQPAHAWDPTKKCAYSTQECLNSMAKKMKSSGWIGIEYDPEKNLSITRVISGSPAEKAGLQVGDVLFAMNGLEIKPENEEAIMAQRKKWTPGMVVRYTVKRDGVARFIDITLGEWPADLLARYIGEHMMMQHAEAGPIAKAPTK